MEKFYAHSLEDDPDPTHWQELESHLQGVAEKAAQFAGAFGSREWGYLAGLWHDLGKYQQAFQDYLIKGGKRGSVHHSPVGAWYALKNKKNLPLSVIIQGHHGGMPARLRLLHDADWSSRSDSLCRATLKASIPEYILHPNLPKEPEWLAGLSDDRARSQAIEFWTRMVFSALVDADFLDTEKWFTGIERPYVSADLPTLVNRLDIHLEALQEHAPITEVNVWRRKVLASCQDAASMPPGVFTLAVPTGGGKTLSGMSFALRHAIAHGLRRVIVVIPWTSIIEQNAEQYRAIFGEENVIEHHSALDPEKVTKDPEQEPLHNRLACENWDAPIIVTTSVQFLESLFSNGTSRCRKLHNIARSAVFFDEVQALPVHLLTPTLSALNELVDHYGVSLILSTATQPALGKRKVGLREFKGLGDPRPIVGDGDALFRAFQRVEVEWPHDFDRPTDWPDLAERIAMHPRVLVIVHKRRDARELVELLPPGTFHLSALMTPQHRSEILRHIKTRLECPSAVCRVVATQLVEAGVDIDFPVVFRAMAGLDSLAQAAGRCNREGMLPGKGRFIVFVAPTQPPKGVLSRGLEVAKGLLRGGNKNLFDPDLYAQYFTRLYDVSELDTQNIQNLRAELNFPEVSMQYRLIEDGWSLPVVVPHDDRSAGLVKRLRYEPPGRSLLRSLQRYTVNVPKWTEWINSGVLEKVGKSETLVLSSDFLHLYDNLYDNTFGLDIFHVPNLPPEFLIA